MDEKYVTDRAQQFVLRWMKSEFQDQQLAWVWRDELVVAKTGKRVDGLVTGIDRKYRTTVVAIEAKSEKTLRQLLGKYDKGQRIKEGIGVAGMLLAAGAAIGVNPLLALFAMPLWSGLRGRLAHTEVSAIKQAMGYPGDYQVLALPLYVWNEFLFDEEREDLKGIAGRIGLGILTVGDTGRCGWKIEPEYQSDQGYFARHQCKLSEYSRGEELRAELEEMLES